MSDRQTCKKCQEVSMSHNLRKFTHVEACCVAFERGVRDGDCDRAARRGRGIDCAALYKVDVPPRDVEHSEPVKRGFSEH